MAVKQILSLVVASTWVANLLIDNQKRAKDENLQLFLLYIVFL